MKNFLSKFGSFLKKWYVVLVLLAIYVPLVLIILISFNGETSRGNIKLNFDVPTFVNYINLFQNDQFINALLNSLLLGVIVTPFSLLFGVLTCYGLWKSRKTTKNFVLNVNIMFVLLTAPWSSRRWRCRWSRRRSGAGPPSPVVSTAAVAAKIDKWVNG